jgi:hypothetical protein
MGDLVIPAGVYLQIKFESSVETFLKMLAEQLQSNAEGVFFAQQEPRARLGCSPFHLKVVSSGNLIGRNYSKVMAILQDVGSRYDNIQGRVLPICVVDNQGVVSLKISSSDCLEIVKQMTELLLGDNIWPVSNDEDLLVSIGSFNGPHTAAFEDWLNGELRSNSSVFPIFHAEFLELSESCGNFIPESVRILRKEQKQVDTASHFKIPEIEKNLDKSSADRGSELSLDSSNQTFEQQSAVQRLVLSLKPISQKLVGGGIIKKDVPKSASIHQNMTRHSIVPSEVKLWQELCAIMIRTLDSLLQSVGPKVSSLACTYILPLFNLSIYALPFNPYCN